jgi:hypothetical protein
MKHPRKGSCTNVFQVGSLMHTLIQRKNMNPADKDISSWDAPFTRKEYAGTYTKGAELFDEPWNKLYSKELRELVMECMMFEPTDRPSVLGVCSFPEHLFHCSYTLRDLLPFLNVSGVLDHLKGTLELAKSLHNS